MNKRKLTSVALNQPAGEATGETLSYSLTKGDGKVIGLSISNNYADADNGKMYITVEQNGFKHLDEVPVNQLIPANGFRMQEIFPHLTEGTVKVTIKSITANSAAANPLRLIFHHEADA